MYRVRMLKDELVSQSFYMVAATIHAYASKDGQHISHDGLVMLNMHMHDLKLIKKNRSAW